MDNNHSLWSQCDAGNWKRTKFCASNQFFNNLSPITCQVGKKKEWQGSITHSLSIQRVGTRPSPVMHPRYMKTVDGYVS